MQGSPLVANPDALAFLDSSRAEPGETLARGIFADWLGENGALLLASLIKQSLRAPGQIHHATTRQFASAPGIRHAVDGWFLGGNRELHALGQNQPAPFLPWVSGLHLSGRGLGPEAQSAILQALPSLWSPSWRILSLSDFSVAPKLFVSVLERGWARQITHMRLGGPLAGSLALEAVCQHAPALQTLELQSAWWRHDPPPRYGPRPHGINQFQPPLELFQTGFHFPEKFKRLSLENYSLAGKSLAGVLDAASRRDLRHLHLNQCHLPTEALVVINQSSIWRSLETLNLIGCRLPKQHLSKNEASLSPIPCNRLRGLTLRACSLTGESLVRLADSGWLAGPVRIDLSQNKLEQLNDGLTGQTLRSGEVESLNLAHCGINAKQLEHWLNLGPWERLGQWNLSANPLGDSGAKTLAPGTLTPSLVSLDLTATGLTSQGLQYLAAGALLPRAQKIQLKGNGLGEGGAWPQSLRDLLRHPAVGQIQQVRLDGIDDWIETEVSHPECRLNAIARKDLLHLVATRRQARRRQEAGEELQGRSRQSTGPHLS
jgi:uncharacterized protein (TIGR02996 family)